MLKKYSAFFFIGVAYAILLGHNIVPHHHHHKDSQSHHHNVADHHHHSDEHLGNSEHHSSHEHESQEENKELGDLFSHFVHADDNFTIAANHLNHVFSKQWLDITALVQGNFSLDSYCIRPLKHKPPAEYPVYISPNLLSSGLRGPPTFII